MARTSITKFKKFLKREGIATERELQTFRITELRVIAEVYGWRL